ncbi:hypothetical protein Tco_0729728 [Tanacetum coccineum]|uniref:DUF4283 domain-containing protein n=1 Tax=Tanacetum coccineum TaxID=301880 RepID=A0ABQ4YQL8_9ASTR
MFSSSTGLFFFQFSSMDGLDAMLENGPWFFQNNPFILKNWHPDVNLLKEDVGTISVWVKLHGVHVTAFNEDGLIVIGVKLGTPLMLASYTFDMCMKSWGKSSYARAMIELRADVELKDNIVVVMHKITREGYYTCNIRVDQATNSSGSSFWNVDASSPSSTPVIKKIDKIEKLIVEGKVTLVDDDGKPFKKVASSCEYDSEDEVASVDNEMANFLAKKDGYGTQSLLEQWTKSYENADYGYDSYDDDMYEG